MPVTNQTTARVTVVPGTCVGDPDTIVIDNTLGGGGQQSHPQLNGYYINFYKKDPLNGCYPVQVPIFNNSQNLQGGYNQKFSWIIPAVKTNGNPYVYTAGQLTDANGATYAVGALGGETPLWTAQQLQAALNSISGTLSTIEIGVVGITVNWYVTATSPHFNPNCSALQFFGTQLGDPTPVITQGTCVVYNTLQQVNRCGWLPVAGGYGLVSYTVPLPGTGVYLVEITDQVGVTNTAVVEIIDRTPDACIIEKEDIKCNGNTNGKLRAVDGFDSSGNIQYEWTESLGGTVISNNKEVTGLPAGTYCLTITNANGCSRTCCETIFEPLPLTLTQLSLTQPTCRECGTNEEFGHAEYEVTGGNIDCEDCGCLYDPCESLAYKVRLNEGEWVDVPRNHIIKLKNLKIGAYIIEVIDCNCCVVQDTFTIVESIIKLRI